MKKVLIIVGDPVGGIRRHIHDILLNSCQQNDIIFHYIHGINPDKQAVVDFEKIDNMRISRFSLSIKKNIHFSDISNLIAIIRYCQKNGIDVIHGHGAKGGIYARVAAIFASAPSIYTPHGGVIHPVFSKLFTGLYRLIEYSLTPFTSFYIFESQYTRDAFLKFVWGMPSSKYCINYGGISIAEKALDDTSWDYSIGNEINILVVGMLREIKGQKIVLLALNELIALSNLQFKVHFCGDGPDMKDLLRLTKELNLEDYTIFHGDVVNIDQFYKMCSLVVIPSLHESFGYVALESANFCRPVIASNVGGLKETVFTGFSGYTFECSNYRDLAGKILDLVNSTSKTSDYVANAKFLLRDKFDLNKQINNLFICYKNILNS